MTTTTTAYRAQTDAGTKRWHAGTEANGNVCVCGTKLMFPGDTRAFALKVAADKRNYTTDANLALIDCGACKRNKTYAAAVTAAEVAAQSAAHAETHPTATRERRRAAQSRTVTEGAAADRAEAAAERTREAAAKPSRRRQSRADKAHAAAERDRERREAAERADAAVSAIDEALAGLGNPEAPADAAVTAAVTQTAEYAAEAAANAE